jgi:hypothetical protein
MLALIMFRIVSASASRFLLLLSVLRQRPREFFDRIVTFLESRVDRGHLGLRYLLCPSVALMQRCGDLSRFLGERPLQEIREHIMRCQREGSLPTSGISHDAGFALASFCYCYCRAHRPETVVETGVGNGVTTAFILQALSVNRSGKLWSVDLPPLGAPDSGSFVPTELKNRWDLRIGQTRRILPSLLRQIGPVDLFLHDSLHTLRNMTFEFNSAWSCLRSGGVLVSDDVAFNRAFKIFVLRPDVEFAAVDDRSFFAAAIKRPSSIASPTCTRSAPASPPLA